MMLFQYRDLPSILYLNKKNIMKSIKILSISILSLIGLSGCFSSDDDKQVASCGDVKIADMNWDSASLMANMTRLS